LTPELFHNHAHRIGLLPRGAGRGPEPKRLSRFPLGKLWQQLFLQDSERVIIAEPECFVRGHRINDHFTEARPTRPFQSVEQFAQGGEFVFFQDSTKAALNQVLFIFAQQNAARILQERFKGFIFLWRYFRFHWISVVCASVSNGITLGR